MPERRDTKFVLWWETGWDIWHYEEVEMQWIKLVLNSICAEDWVWTTVHAQWIHEDNECMCLW